MVLMLTLRAIVGGGRATFIIWICAIYGFLCGNFALFPMVTAKAFGQKYMGINYGMVFTSNVKFCSMQKFQLIVKHMLATILDR